MKSILIFVFVVLLSVGVYSKNNNNNKGKRNLVKVSGSQLSVQRMDINNLNALESNAGFSDYNLNSALEGTEFPKGSNKNVIFESGFLWGGFVKGDISSQVRVGGSTYITGLQPGPILSNGQAADPSDSRWSIYRVRPDVYPGGPAVDLSSSVAAYAEGGQTFSESQLRAQYESDWTNWPAHGSTVGAPDLGAPFKDVKGDGNYDPTVDIPGVPGADQTCYFVANDMDSVLTKNLYGSLPLGIELHAAYWAYNQGGAPGNIYFKKYTLINKGYQHNEIDSMFISFWVDPDIGNTNDDLVGTDTTLNLICAYNGEATDAVCSPLTPPSVGFSLLEGPIINGNSTDTAIFKGKKLTGKKNLPMTASYFFINGNANFGDPQFGTPTGANQFYNFFNGHYGLSGQPFITPNGQITKYIFPGDPVAGTGWVDGNQNPPADRRQGMASGPFSMAPGDTQEVIFAELCGEGTDYLHSVYNVKEYQYYAASLFRNSINGIKSPPSPLPIAISLSNDSSSIQIQWDNKAESFNQSGYSFEGYNIYQLPFPFDSKESAKLIATFDKIDGITTIYGQALNPQTDQVYSQIQQSGRDSGLQYSFKPAIDYINNYHFIKGEKYYYAVTAYNYNPAVNANPTNTESSFQPGSINYNYYLAGPNYGDTVQVTHIAGQSGGNVTVIIADPSKLKGHNYNVLFDTLNGAIVWSLKDMNIDAVLISKQTLNTSQVIDGLNIKVTSPNPGMNAGGEGIGWTIPNGTRRISWGTTSLLTNMGLEGFNGAIGWASPDYTYYSDPESVPASSICNTLLTFAQVTDTSLYNPVFPAASDVNLSYGYRYLRHASVAPADQRFIPYIINTTGGTYPFQDFKQSVPLSAWNVDNAAHPVRLALGYLENNAAGGLVDGKYWPPDYTQLDQANTREFLWIFQAPYSTTANASFEGDALSTANPIPVMWFCIFSRKGAVPFSPNGTGTDQFLIIKNNAIGLNDVFAFNSSNLTDVKAKNIISKYSLSQNYPNPFNPTTIIEFSLPKTEHIVINIYDILGRKVATLLDEVKPTGSYSVQFNAGKYASGVYFYRMQAGSFTETKKLILMK